LIIERNSNRIDKLVIDNYKIESKMMVDDEKEQVELYI